MREHSERKGHRAPEAELGDESLEDSENLPEPDVIAAEIVGNLEVALEQFGSIYQELEGGE